MKIQMGEVEEEIHCKEEEGERVTEKHASKLCQFDQILQNYKGRYGLLRGEDMEDQHIIPDKVQRMLMVISNLSVKNYHHHHLTYHLDKGCEKYNMP